MKNIYIEGGMFGYFFKFLFAALVVSTTIGTTVFGVSVISSYTGHAGGYSVPEIDAAAGLAAMSVLACAVAIAREKFLRK